MAFSRGMATAAASPRYRILETIGKGGMGEVCLAEDLLLHRNVAVKFLVSPSDNGGGAVDQLLREARAAAALDHPFICKIFEVTVLESRSCIVMEYVPGETIERRLRHGPFPVTEGLRLAEEIAEAIEAAHKRRLVHRDLKPANVMVTDSDHIKVMDFGLATTLLIDAANPGSIMTREPAEAGLLIGTPAYMSPEQASGGSVDYRSDIFAFGTLLYELLSGHHPFLRAGLEATLEAVRRDTPVELHLRAPAVPKTVGSVVAQMLAKNPAERYQSFGDIRVDLRRLSGELASPAEFRTRPIIVEPVPGGAGGPFVARESEREELLRSFTRARNGRGSLIFLSGEAGIGKSRLVEEAFIDARRLGFLTLVGRCSEQEDMHPLLPYVEVLEEAARLLPISAFRQAMGPTAAELATLVPVLHRLFDELPPPLELPPDLRQRFLFNSVKEFLIRCARLTPLVIFLDDLHWADESTLRLTKHLAPELDKQPVVVLAAFRDKDSTARPQRGLTQALSHVLGRVRGEAHDAANRHHPLARIVDQLVESRQARLVPITTLSEPKVGSLLAALGHTDPPMTLVRTFFEATGGNPFFVEELFRHLNEEQKLFDSKNQWRRELEVDTMHVPAGVRLVITRRLKRVSSRTRGVLTAAAVIGPYFELDLLEVVADVSSDALAAALEQAELAHLLNGPSGRQERRWRFAHQLIRQTLISDVPQHKRQRLHLRIADAMGRFNAGSGTYAEDIAHHLYSAGAMADTTRTALALIAAGDATRAIYATDEAVRHYRRVLEISKGVRELHADRIGVEERLADLLTLTGDRAGAMEHYLNVEHLCAPSQGRVDPARIVRKMGTLHWMGGDRAQATACYERALALLQGEAAHVEPALELAHVYRELGLAAFRRGDNQTAIDWAKRAVTSAEAALAAAGGVKPEVRGTAHAALAHATNTIGVSLARLGQLEAAREHIEQSLAIAREYSLLDVACRGYTNLGVLYSTVEPKRAIEASLTGLELATKIGAASLQPYMYANLAAAYCALTDRCETEGLLAARAAASLDRELGQLDHLAVPLIVMAQIHQCQGELQQAQDAYREALTFAEKIGEAQLLFPCYDGLATICLDRGNTTMAEEYMQKAQQVCERAGVDPDALLILPFLC